MPKSKNTVILEAQLQQAFRLIPLAITSSLAMAVINALALWSVAPHTYVFIWVLATAIISWGRYAVYRMYGRQPERYSYNVWVGLGVLPAVLFGVNWGLAFIVLMPTDSLVHQVLLVVTTAGLCSGAAGTLVLFPSIFLVFMASCLMPMSVSLYVIDRDYGWFMFLLCYMYMYYMWLSCKGNNTILNQNIEQSVSLSEKALALKASQGRVDLHFERSPLGIIEWDENQNVIGWNPAAETIFGYTAKEILGQKLTRILSDVDNKPYLAMIGQEGEEASTILDNIKKDGVSIRCEWTSAAIHLEDDKVRYYTTFVRDITERLKREEMIAHQAYYDTVTELPNRRYFQNHLVKEISRTLRTKKYSAVFFIDLDHFKAINDSMGHSVGDKLLYEFARRLRNRLRPYDTVARFGGDEFVILLEELHVEYDKAQLLATQVARSLQLLVQTPFILDGTECSLTCSIGISLFNNDHFSEDELLTQADLALYQSKDKGRNTYTFFEQEMSDRASRHLQLLNNLRGAITRQELALVFQPKIDINSNQIKGAEALLRWNSDTFGFVPPGEFIPILEESALISEVGLWVLDHSFKQLAEWVSAGIWSAEMGLAINISPKQLLETSFVEQVEVLLARHELSAALLEFEITENVLVENTDKVAAVLMALTSLGISFSIDDFGTGYSSLAYLKQLPIAVLKIDKSFIDNCTVEGNDQAIVRSILSICHELGLISVAEGVEHEEQRKQLQVMGCNLLQGYLFSRPLPANEFVKLLRK